jgi:hypothetical protein
MKRLIYCLLTIMISAGMSPALDLPSGNCTEKMQVTGDHLYLEAAPKSINANGLNIWFPDNWKINNTSDELLATSPDNTACVLMKPIDLNALDPGIRDFKSFGEKFVEEFKTTNKVTILKSIKLPLNFWASTDIPWDWKKLAFIPGTSITRQSEQPQLKLLTAEGVGKLGASERWASITLVGLPNGRVLLLFSVSGLEKAVVDSNRQEFGKILRSLKPE